MPATAVFPPTATSRRSPSEPPRRCPSGRRRVFVGALEPYKNIDGLAAAWRLRRRAAARGAARDRRQRLAAPRRRRRSCRTSPAASSTTSGSSRRRSRPRSTTATVLVLPSWPEGLGRVIIEAFARGRGGRRDGRGRHPRPRHGRRRGLARSRRPTSTRSASRARARAHRPRARRAARRGGAASATRDWHSTPEQFAARLRELVERASPGRLADAARLRHADASTPTTRRSPRRVDLVRALAARVEAVVVLCDRVGRARAAGERRACGRSARATASARGLRFERALRPSCSRRHAPRRGARAHGPALRRRSPRRSRRRAACRSCSGTRTGTRAARCGSRLRLADVVLSVDRRSFPLEIAEGARDRPRDRRRAVHARGRTARARRAAAAARARPDGALEGLRHDARRARLAAERGSTRARDPRPGADRRRATRTAPSWRRSSRPSDVAARPRADRAAASPRDEIPALLRAADALVSATQPRGARRSTRSSTRRRRAACRWSRATPRSTSSSAGFPSSSVPGARRGGARGALARLRRGRPGGARATRARAAPPRRRAATRSTRGRTPSRRSLPPRPASNIVAVATQPSEPALARARDARRPRGAAVRLPRAAPLRTFGAPRARDRVARAARRSSGSSLGLYLALVLRSSSSATRSSGACSADGVRGVAAVPDPDHPARLLAGRAVRRRASGAPASAGSRRRCCSSR